MGDIIDFCQKILADDNFEGVFVPQNNDNNSRINKKRKSDIKLKEVKDIFIPLNSTGENINFNKLKSANKNRNNSEENNKVNINRNGCISGEENELISSMNKMNKMIESLENKNKILEDEKLEMKKENDKLLEEIKSYKDTISKFKNLSNSQNDKNENGNANGNKSKTLKEVDENDGKVKIIFLFKNKKNGNEEDSKESREEIIGYKYEMFVEVKLRLLNLKHLGPTDIKTCYYNSKEINDWYTLEELNIADNTYVVCEYA
jgi:hypothetical protein